MYLWAGARCTAWTGAPLFDTRAFELWACVPEFHARKFGDFANWRTYKEPLKYLIHAFDGEDEHYRCKEKVASLNFDLGRPSTLECNARNCCASCAGFSDSWPHCHPCGWP